jgi:hypothetical protein
MKYAVEMGSGGMTYIPCSTNTDSGIQIFQTKESGLKFGFVSWRTKKYVIYYSLRNL